MKKRNILFVALVCVVVICTIVVAFSGRKPFRDLQPSDVVSATVHLTPPDKTIQITEIPELVSYLKEVVIYNEDNSYVEYTGQAVFFTLNMSDGSQVSIEEYNPFIIIDGVGYKTKYEPCEDLNNYANQLLRATSDS